MSEITEKCIHAKLCCSPTQSCSYNLCALTLILPPPVHVILYAYTSKALKKYLCNNCAIKTSLCRQLPDLPTQVIEPLLKLCFPLNPSRHVTNISAYAPTLTISDEAKDALYEELNVLVKDVPQSDKLILLGDFTVTATTGKEYKDLMAQGS